MKKRPSLMKKRPSLKKRKNSQKGKANSRILIGILILFLLGGGILAGPSIINRYLDQPPAKEPNLETPITPSSNPINSTISSPNTIIYGVWNSNN